MSTLEGGRGARTGIEAVSAAVLAMSRHLEVGEVLQTIVTSARELIGAEYAALGVPDDHGGFAQFVVDGVSDREWKAIGPLPRQHGILAVMLHEATTQRLGDVREHPRFEGWPSAHPDMTDFIGVPVLDGDEILGALFLANKTGCDDGRPGTRGTAADAPDPDAPDPDATAADVTDATPGTTAPRRECAFTDEDEALLHILAAHAALALGNARLHERSRELSIAEERGRIAHELHDAVSQKLFSLRLTAQAATALVDRDPARAKAELAQITALAAEAAEELRAVVVELRPAALDEDGLVATLRTQVDVLDRAHSAAVAFACRGMRALPSGQEEAVLRVAQEALHNALRHADAAHVSVLLEGRDKGAVLRVTDDGRGFDPSAVRRAGRHLGLVSMRDRARRAGGSLRVTSEPGRGTVIEMEVPGG